MSAGVSLRKVESKPVGRKGKHRSVRYQVFLAGTLIGEVCSEYEKSYRSDGIGSPTLYGFRGYSKTWRCRFPGEWAAVASGYDRTVAVKNFLAEYFRRQEAGTA